MTEEKSEQIETVESVGRSRRARYSGKRRRKKEKGRKPKVHKEKAPKVKKLRPKAEDTYNYEFKKSLLPVKWWPILLWSLVISLFSVANPLLTFLANNLQSQDLYAGLAMQAGQAPYKYFFGTDGLLYYLLTYLGSFGGTTLILMGLQAIALLVAGIYFYKICAYFSRDAKITNQLVHWFYLFIWALTFGGVYSSVFVLPFLFTSIWFLVRFFEDAVRDEAFILFGLDATLVFALAPKSVLLWLVAFAVIFIYNLRRKRFARGFYQFLATIFGMLLVLYPLSYVAFVNENIGGLIQQTIQYNLRFDVSRPEFLWILGAVVAVIVVSGFLKNSIQTAISFRRREHRYIRCLIFFAFWAQLAYIIFASSFDASQLLLLLPYGFVMAVIYMTPQSDLPEENAAEEAEESVIEEVEQPSYSYLKLHYFLPILLVLAIPAYPIYKVVQEGNLTHERQQIAAYISEKKEKGAKIYAWDDNASIYLDSQLTSVAPIITAKPYLDTQKNVDAINFGLSDNAAQFIVVNKDLPLTSPVKATLKQYYKKVNLDVKNFTVYQRN